jgi:hypothetical protein
MRIEITRLTNWSEALNSARFTQRKKAISGEPSINWKKKLIKAEHSPLRCVMYNIDMYDIPFRTSVHFVRHVHAQPFSSTSRPDIDGKMPPRSEQKKDDPVNLRLLINAEEIINISRKRLCNKAEKETRETWQAVVDELRKIEPELANACVPQCLSKSYCPEFKSCGFADSDLFILKLHNFHNSLN